MNTYLIIFICFAYYIIEIVYAKKSGSFIYPNFDINILKELGAEYSGSPFINNFTSIFMHADLLHLLSNMFCLSILFNILYSRVGVFKTDVIFLSTGIISNVISQMYGKGVSVGASGGIFGVVGFLLVVELYRKIKKEQISYFNDIFFFFIYNFVITFLNSNINVYSHASGFVSGLILAIGYLILKRI